MVYFLLIKDSACYIKYHFYCHQLFKLFPDSIQSAHTVGAQYNTCVLQNSKNKNPQSRCYFFLCTYISLDTNIHRNLPTPGIGVQGVLGIAPVRIDADTADLSGGPPGAERGTSSVGRAKWEKDTTTETSSFSFK